MSAFLVLMALASHAPAIQARPVVGGVALAWRSPRAAAQVHFQRYPKDAEAYEAPPTYERTLVLPANGSWVDRDVADGTRYIYRFDDGSTAEAETPAVRLPGLTRPELRVDKATYVLAVVDAGKVVKRYPVALGRSPKTRKTCFDNASTPEGVYHITGRQPRATYHRAYDLSYPNAADQARWRAAKAVDPGYPPIGGEIQIHGRGIHANWTYGCIALRDADIDELFARPAIAAGTTVRIWGGALKASDVGIK